MESLANIINSIPEPLAIAIITATFTGIVVFFVQKRMENSFGEKMETFKAHLQKSLFEYQTKFERHHTKAVETLECLYQKILVISKKYEEMVYSAIDYYKKNQEFIKPLNLRLLGLDKKEIEDLQLKSNDFITYFNSNRLYFPKGSIREVKSIHGRVDGLIQLIEYYMGLLVDFDDTSLEYFQRLNESLSKLDFIRHTTIEDEWDFLLLFSDFVDEMNKQTERLEYLYKSVSDIQE